MTTEVILTIAGVALFLLVLLALNIRIVPQSKAWVMERLGVYSRTWHTGLHIKLPFIERAAKKVDLREQILVCGEGFNHNHYHDHKDGYKYENGALRGAFTGAGAISDIAGLKESSAMAMQAGSSEKTKKNSSKNSEGMGLVDAAQLEFENTQLRLGQYEANAGIGGYRGSVTHNNRSHSRTSQPVITKDNVSMEIDTVVFYQITDPKLFAYGHKEPLKAVEHIVATSLRNIVGGLELDETLTARDKINMGIRKSLDEVSDAWGLKITRVEIRNIIISDVELAEAMEKQMIAEREKRAEILRAEANKTSKILIAEGESQSKILEAEAAKKAEILVAEGKAEHIRLVNDAAPSQEFLNIRALEAYEKAADGQATKIIVPSNLQSLAGLALSGSEVFKEGEKMGE